MTTPRRLSPAHVTLWEERQAKKIGTSPLARKHATRIEAVLRAALMQGIRNTENEIRIIEFPGVTELRIKIAYPKEDTAP